ncbi:MAG: hypothetical protein KAS32_23120 [Candidatus Peribacteraceae bacterium]|nr:hypothetical protein [Candidatus Peribacteraceae bacterium]
MALVTSRTSLSQGASSSESVAWTASSGANTTLTGTGLPVVAVDDFFEIRLSPITGNNGLYIATGTPTTSSVSCTKVFGTDPTDDTSETITWLGDTTTYKSVFFDTTNNGSIALLEQGNLSVDGAIGQSVYSFAMQEWKDDSFLIANSPFPMLTIDSDAGKYIIGQDISGNNNGAIWLDNVTHSIRTRKLLRNAGWDEVDSDGNTTARWVGVVTLGAFEDSANDTAYYQFGSDTTTDDTVDFDFAGPVNEAVQFFEEQPRTDLDIAATTITRVGGSFITEGYKVGGQATIRNAEDSGNDGDWTLTAVTATVLTTTGLTVNADDTSAILAVNNDNAITLRLRVRDGDAKGKTFAQGDLASAGKTILGNFVYSFPLANGSDQKIDVTDVGIDSDSNGAADVSPYSGMSITYHSTPQSRTDLVGGSADFGIIVDGNDGTAQQVFEFIQWSLRSTGGFGTGDIDADADTAIGRTMDGLAGFVGDTGHFGTPDNGLSFPTNPDGGGSGVYVDSLNALSKNDVVYYDNTNAGKTFPETIAVTLDFNQIAIDDTTTEYDLFYDRTIRTAAASLTDFVLTNATSKITSALGNLPTNSEIAVGKYVRVSGLTGADEPMNGVYQITIINTVGEDWTVARYDGVTIVDVTTTAVDMDQNCVDTPDAILVHSNVRTAEVSEPLNPGTAVLTFTSPDTITDATSTFGSFASGMFIQVENSTANDGIYEIDTAAAGTLTLIEQTIVTEAVGVDTDVAVTEVVSGLAANDVTFSYDFDNNEQGGRTVSTTTYVKAKAIGSIGAQYIQSSVADIVSGTPETIPVAPATERNYA